MEDCAIRAKNGKKRLHFPLADDRIRLFWIEALVTCRRRIPYCCIKDSQNSKKVNMQDSYIGSTSASQAKVVFARKYFVFSGFKVFENDFSEIVTLNVTLYNFICGCRLMAGPQLPKLATRVRFPSSAPKNSCKIIWFCNYFFFFDRFCSLAEFENVTLWEAEQLRHIADRQKCAIFG